MANEDPDLFTDDWLVSHPDCVAWFDDPDIRDCSITFWPDEYVDFIDLVIQEFASRNPEVTAKNFWVLGKCIAGTLFEDRLTECRNSWKILLEVGPRLRPSDLVPPVLSHELESCREVVCDDADWNIQFVDLLLHVMDEPCELSTVTSKVCQLFEDTDPPNEAYYYLRDGFAFLLASLFPWVIRDVELGRPLGAGPSDIISADYSKSVADLLSGEPTVLLHEDDGLNETERTLTWGGRRFDELTPAMMRYLRLLLDENRKDNHRVHKDAIVRRAQVASGAKSQTFKNNRTDERGKRSKDWHEVEVVVIDHGGGFYGLIDPAKVPTKVPTRP